MSPRSESQLEAIRTKSKERILLAALELFAEKGYHNTSIKAVAERAKVAKGLIYNYFDKKEDLLQGILDQAMQIGEGMMSAMMKIQHPLERIQLLVEFSAKHLLEHTHYHKLLFALSVQIDEFPLLKEQVLAKYEQQMPMFIHLFEEAGIEPAEEEAHLLASLLDGMGMQFLIMGDTLRLQKMRDYIINTYLPDKSSLNSA